MAKNERRQATSGRLVFVGECRSLTAQKKGWTWKDGRLAAKPLFEALRAMGVDPALHQYVNLWTDNASGETYASLAPGVLPRTLALLEACCKAGHVVVALGQRVSAELTARSLDHVALVHPAARGRIRKRERYIAHVAERLGPYTVGQTGTDRHDPEREPCSRASRHGREVR
jgi:hypothetical protein